MNDEFIKNMKREKDFRISPFLYELASYSGYRITRNFRVYRKSIRTIGSRKSGFRSWRNPDWDGGDLGIGGRKGGALSFFR